MNKAIVEEDQSLHSRRVSNDQSLAISPWSKIASAVLTKGPSGMDKIRSYNDYFEQKMEMEQRINKFPFEKDAALESIVQGRLQIAEERALYQEALNARHSSGPTRKITLRATLDCLEDIHNQLLIRELHKKITSKHHSKESSPDKRIYYKQVSSTRPPDSPSHKLQIFASSFEQSANGSFIKSLESHRPSYLELISPY